MNRAEKRLRWNLKRNRTDAERFWEKVDKSKGLNACWLWLGACGPHGYGATFIANKHIKAHRAAYVLTFGPIPRGVGYHGMCVLHRCDRPGCVNPEHLFLGSNADNAADKANKQRGGMARLNKEKARAIRALYYDFPLTLKQLGNAFGVNFKTVHDVVKNKTWKHA